MVCRGRAMGDWHWRKSSWLNLVDDEAVGVLLFTVEEVAGPAFELPPAEAVGEHSSTRWMLWTLSDTGYVRDVEGASAELLGYEPDEIVGHHATAFIPANAVADGIAMWVELQKGQRNMATNRRHWTRRDGSHIWLEDSYLHRVGPDGQPVVLAVMWDATDRMVQEEALRDREEELRALAAEKQALAGDFKLLADELPAAVFRCDAAGFVLFHNARWNELVETRDGVARLHDVVARSDHAALDRALAEEQYVSVAVALLVNYVLLVRERPRRFVVLVVVRCIAAFLRRRGDHRECGRPGELPRSINAAVEGAEADTAARRLEAGPEGVDRHDVVVALRQDPNVFKRAPPEFHVPLILRHVGSMRAAAKEGKSLHPPPQHSSCYAGGSRSASASATCRIATMSSGPAVRHSCLAWRGGSTGTPRSSSRASIGQSPSTQQNTPRPAPRRAQCPRGPGEPRRPGRARPRPASSDHVRAPGGVRSAGPGDRRDTRRRCDRGSAWRR